MANTSATGGYLPPAGSPAPLEDASLDAAFQKAVVGITGLPGSMVRPRWQSTMPKQPEASVNWCAIGVLIQSADNGPAINHDPSGDGSDGYVRHEDIELLASFYGPNGAGFAALFRDGIAMPQNVEGLRVDGISFVECGQIRSAPEFFNQQWFRRFDMQARFRRKVTRTYPVLNVLSADINLKDDTWLDATIAVQPAP